MPWVKPKLPQEKVSLLLTCYKDEKPSKMSQVKLQEESLQNMRLFKHWISLLKVKICS